MRGDAVTGAAGSTEGAQPRTKVEYRKIYTQCLSFEFCFLRWVLGHIVSESVRVPLLIVHRLVRNRMYAGTVRSRVPTTVETQYAVTNQSNIVQGMTTRHHIQYIYCSLYEPVLLPRTGSAARMGYACDHVLYVLNMPR